MALEDAGLGQLGRQVERGLAAQAGQQALRPLLGDDRLDGLDGQRLEVDGVGDLGVGHDRGRVRVDEDRPHALGPQRAAGLRPGVVELGGLADDDRAAAEDEDGRRLVARLGHARPPAPDGGHEAVEHGQRVERAGRALGVVLDRLDGLVGVAQPLDRAVVEVDLADPEAAARRQRVADDLDLVVLGGDLDEPEVDVLDRVVGPVMPEAQPAGVRARGPAHDLVTEADAQERPAVVDDRPGEGDLGLEPGRVARAGRQDDAVDVAGQDLGGGRRVREDPDAGAAVAHRAHDVRLQAQVDDADERAALVARAVLGDGRRRDLGHEVLVLPAGHGAGRRAGGVLVELARRGDDPAQAAVGAQMAGQRPRVDPGDGRDAVVAQQGRELAGVLEHGGRGVGHDQRAQPRTAGLVVGDEPAVVADERVGHDHDLAGVRGVGADLLVAGLAGVDDEVAAGRTGAPKATPGKTAPSSSASNAGPRSPIRGSTMALDRGNGGTITRRRRPTQQMTHPPQGRGGRGRALTSSLLRRPHRTGTPASRDRPSKDAVRVAVSGRGTGGRRPGRPAIIDGSCPTALPRRCASA